MIDVSVIIVTYNTKNLTLQCIDSIFLQTRHVSFEIILIDNASTDGSREIFQQDKRITYIYSNQNLGFGKANNLGYSQTSGRYIFLLNSDTILLNDALSEFVLYFDKHADSDVACAGAVLKKKDGITENNSYSQFPSICNTISFFMHYYLRIKPKRRISSNGKYPLTVDYIIGADLFIKRDVVEQLGLFDESFFMYYEDSELQLRYHNHGYRSVIISSPEIIHLEGASTCSGNRLTGKKAEMYFNGMLTYMGKRYAGIKYLAARLILLLFIPMLIYNNTIKLIPLLFKSKSHFNESLH